MNFKEYYQANKQKIRQQQKQYYDTPNGKKHHMIKMWRRRGLIGNHNHIYEHYLNTHKCDVCDYQFDDLNWRCLDHDHETGQFRQILCNNCNVHDRWVNRSRSISRTGASAINQQ
jgi:hypothetical protein